jgi:hypothetical protein
VLTVVAIMTALLTYYLLGTVLMLYMDLLGD